MRFFLFIAANALLFIRPSEFISELNAMELYRYVILLCLAVSLPAVLQQCSLRFEGVPPIVTCVVLLLPAVFLSGLFHGDGALLVDTVVEFAKVLIYFLLLLALITDVRRLRQLLYALGLCSALVTLVAVVRYHSDAQKPAPVSEISADGKNKLHGTFVVDEVRDPQTGQISFVNRMCGTGIFNDPNDLALVLVTAIPLAFYWLTDPTRKWSRPIWVGLLVLFAYALTLTYSRGGFIALVAGLGTLFHLRFGAKKTVLISGLCIPLLLVVFAGRMTTLSTEDGTGQSRIQLWSDALLAFREAPFFGVGMDNIRQFCSQVAHNSFIHCYAELGLFGGSLFVGAFYMAIKGLYELRHRAAEADQCEAFDPELRRLHPYLMSMLVAYTIGICFLSRSYVVPTYLFLGLAVVYMRLHAENLEAPVSSWNRFVWPRLAGVSLGFLIASHSFVRLFVQW